MKKPDKKRFGRLVFMERHPSKSRSVMWRCLCDCGQIKIARSGHIKSGRTSSCGCLSNELTVTRSTKHGMHGTPEYAAWCNIRNRCNNPTSNSYIYYGARGIRVCDRWLSFDSFFADMGRRPSSDHSIERNDPNGNYCPENCRWATEKEQQGNKRSTVRYLFNGEYRTEPQWAGRRGFGRQVIYRRIRSGWSIEKAMTQPVRVTKRSVVA